MLTPKHLKVIGLYGYGLRVRFSYRVLSLEQNYYSTLACGEEVVVIFPTSYLSETKIPRLVRFDRYLGIKGGVDIMERM